jgi:hypothetical protein
MKECVDLGAPLVLILGLRLDSLTEKEEKFHETYQVAGAPTSARD